jgi:hypothetical protein
MDKPDKPIKTDIVEIPNLQIWDTASVQKKLRVSYFREAVCKTFLQITPELPETGFGVARVKRMSIADGAISTVSACVHRASREKSDVLYQIY